MTKKVFQYRVLVSAQLGYFSSTRLVFLQLGLPLLHDLDLEIVDKVVESWPLNVRKFQPRLQPPHLALHGLDPSCQRASLVGDDPDVGRDDFLLTVGKGADLQVPDPCRDLFGLLQLGLQLPDVVKDSVNVIFQVWEVMFWCQRHFLDFSEIFLSESHFLKICRNWFSWTSFSLF